MASSFKSVGFIGLGLMGKPMAGHLATKLPAETRVYIFDVVPDAVKQLCSEHPDKVFEGASAKDVADKAVRRWHARHAHHTCIDIRVYRT